MEQYIERIKAVPVAAGHEGVFYPGELEARNDLKHHKEGLSLAQDTLADLARVAQAAKLADFNLGD
jgi:LDH2 family malate/lactate/ureidoglycolate dehydrogenase